MSSTILTVQIRLEQDVVLARQRARQVAALLGLDLQDQTRVATAVSEIARNAFQYAGGGRMELGVQHGRPPEMVACVSDDGPGISNVQSILDGQYVSHTGMGMGILGARRLMDRFDVRCIPGKGTRVVLCKRLSVDAPLITPAMLSRVAAELARQSPQSPFEEVQRQNQELLQALDELRSRQSELERLNRELEETNRGVVALYAELDERADFLQRTSQLKSRFLSDMSHEFRTPLNAILSLSDLLLDRTDGDLSEEQEKQVAFIHKGAQDLSELVNDLLDLAKAEAGKLVVTPVEFEVAELFGTLRGMLRPLLSTASASLVFDDPAGVPPLNTDDRKVSQILRNFISNALKYTPSGEVRVWAECGSDDSIRFAVADTGIGIALEDHERIFQDFVQVEGPHQRRVKGTGLGLPLSRRLAELLGGRVTLSSEPGVGSTFYVELPRHYKGPAALSLVPDVIPPPDPARLPVLVVEDNHETLFLYEKYLKGTGFQVIPARTLASARRVLQNTRPVAVVLDILLNGQSAWTLLSDLKADPATRDIPVLVATVVDNSAKAMLMGAEAFARKPLDREWLLEKLNGWARRLPAQRALVIDDDEVSRYVLKSLLADTRYQVIEAATAEEGLRCARSERPDVIFLDLMMPDRDGGAVLDDLKADPELGSIPVIIHTSQRLSPEQRMRLGQAAAILSKDNESREAALHRLRQALGRLGQAPEVEEKAANGR